jgi:type II secretory ATPase GspE/PulE/Tfp pilus assembly ATPase PilB-like protein
MTLPADAFAVLDPVLPLLQSALPEGAWFAWWKILIVVVLALVWLRLMLWIDKDSLAARLPREGINAGLWGAFVLACILFLTLPFFPLAAAAFVAIMLASVVGYLLWRRSVVGLDDLPEQFSGFLTGLVTFGSGSKGPRKNKEEVVELGLVTLLDAKGNKPAVPAEDDPDRAGFETAHRVLADPLYKGAERVSFIQVKARPAGEGADQPGDRYATKYTVDGFDYAGTAYDHDAAVAAVGYIKGLAGLEADERRKVQKGKMKARTAAGVVDVDVISSGTRTGESLVFEVDAAKRYAHRATALGFSSAQRELLADVIDQHRGLVLVAAPPGGGLDALLHGFIREHDAFTRHIITLERSPKVELDGVTQEKIPEGADAAAEQKQASWIADQQPDIFVLDRIGSRGAAGEVIRLVRDDHLAYVGLRAPDTATALKQWVALINEPRTALAELRLVVAGRVMRKLCPACKIPYEPGEAALAKMGLPKGKVSTLYKARTEPMLDERGNPHICEMCGGLGYNGRVGAFEVLPVTDESRNQLVKDHSGTVIRGLLRNAKLPTLNEAALRQVVAGNTDLQEVQRVMSLTAERSGRPSAAKPRPAAAAAS